MDNSTKRLRILITALSMLILLTGAVQAQNKTDTKICPAGSGPGMGGQRMAECLGLTEEQQTAIADIRSKTCDANIELRKENQRLQNQLEGELLQENPSEKKVLELAAQIDEARAELHANRLKMRLAVRQQLTPEQRDKMLVMRDKFKKGSRRGGHWGQSRGNGRGYGPGAGCQFGDGQGCRQGATRRGGCGSGR